ncbi:MgtC family [Geoglobus ahangari]|uniref:MgtC family n=1 Tax=Geoglobus ahangari TaxID=113653 RepID=A0A0F7DBU2_9EURY|nr:MgtC/SapB family protein [Geoglobus ahangari]AKG91686.1 MgtC family [Geoglobus ahangari]NOY10974.1 MgtC/SapB family protein [Archaeoglobi archaeon]
MEELLALLLSAALGGVIGYERSKVHKPAGLRTHILVSLGSCLFMILSVKFFDDPARIAAGVVSGIGFIGAGTIIAERREKTKVVGITTAASLWVTAAIGMAVGMGEYLLALFTTILTYVILQLKKVEERIESS